MADYWISFRIKRDTEAGYNKRYNDLIDAISEHASGAWETDTSFLAIRSASSIDTIGQSLKKALNTTSDHLVIRRIDYMSTRYINDPGENFLTFFPKAKRL